jgi:hypothetical protein
LLSVGNGSGNGPNSVRSEEEKVLTHITVCSKVNTSEIKVYCPRGCTLLNYSYKGELMYSCACFITPCKGCGYNMPDEFIEAMECMFNYAVSQYKVYAPLVTEKS